MALAAAAPAFPPTLDPDVVAVVEDVGPLPRPWPFPPPEPAGSWLFVGFHKAVSFAVLFDALSASLAQACLPLTRLSSFAALDLIERSDRVCPTLHGA